MLRFLADESCDFAVVRALREDGFDVLAISETMQRSDDRELIVRAHKENRILLTEDKDFGWLVYASDEHSAGVVLMRFPGNARSTLVDAVRSVVQEHGRKLAGMFVVIQPGLTRIGRSRI
jgi:predicted nuclease of predicted toxin-antitoxin system